MNKLDLLKTATSGVISYSTSRVIANVIIATTPPGTKLYSKILLQVGSYAIGAVLADKASKAAADFVDTTAEEIRNVKKTFKEAQTKAE